MTKWTEEQSLAIEKENTNIIVSASAGSGKTAVLSERVIRKLKNNVKIDELLILTFTKAAAKEMKERIKDKIIEENLIDNLKLLNKSYITTFDSFALSIVKKYHYILNLSPNISIEEGGILNIKTKKLLDEVMDELYSENNSKFVKFITDFCLKDDTELKKQLLNLYSKLDLKNDKNEYLSNYVNKYLSDIYLNSLKKDYLNLIKSKLNTVQEYFNLLINYSENEYIEKVNDILNPLLESTTYDEIKQNIVSTLPQLPRNSSQELKDIKETITKLLVEINELCSYEENELIDLIKDTKENTEMIILIMEKLSKKIEKFKYENELFSFNDIAKMAIQIVKNNETIRQELKNQFNEIMIDEYQDTSDLQEEFINLIENDTVYMVGDIKQSIYRFRNANPYIFKNKYDNYKNNINGFKIDLSKNFRSREEVINNINNIFKNIMNDDIGGANYIADHSMVFGNDKYSTTGNNNISNDIEIFNYEYDKDTKYTKEEIEIFFVANDIKNKVLNKYQVMDKKTNKLRDITYNDFVILMNKSKNFELYKKIFEYLEIPLTIKRDDNLLNNININIIKNICELILLQKNKQFDDNYKYNFLSIGRSYLFQYDDNTLFDMIKNNNYNSELYKLIDEMIPYTEESIHIFISELFNKLNIYEKIIKIGNIEENLTVLDYLNKVSESLENIGYNIDDFTSYLSDLIEQGLDLKYSITDHFNDSVKIMTIHGSKGLEFPICYYTGLYSKFNIRELNEKILFNDHIVIPYINGYFRKTIDYYLLKNNYIKEEISEQIRLFYVALTRAREKMIIVVSSKDKNNLIENNIVMGRLNYRSFEDIISSIKVNLENYIKPLNIESLNITKDYQYSKYKEYKIRDDEYLNVLELNIEEPSLEEVKYSKEQNKLITNEQKELYEFGNKIHSVMENIDFENPNYDVDLPNIYIEKIKKFFKTSLFNEKIINVYKEYDFIDNNQGTIDLILEYENVIRIVDYKLKNIDDESYKNQLLGYKKYIEKMSDKKVEIYLYSILNEELREINV